MICCPEYLAGVSASAAVANATGFAPVPCCSWFVASVVTTTAAVVFAPVNAAVTVTTTVSC